MRYPGVNNSGDEYQRAINYMPPYETYIEPLLGSGAINKNNRPAQTNIGFDQSLKVNDPASSLASERQDIGWRHNCTFRFLGNRNIRKETVVYLDPP